MNLNNLFPNAFYDDSSGRPTTLAPNGDGSYLYRLNITSNADPATGAMGWSCYEVRLWGSPTKSAIKRGVIRSLLDETEEFALINAYNRTQLGWDDCPETVARYVSHLHLLDALDALLAADTAVPDVTPTLRSNRL